MLPLTASALVPARPSPFCAPFVRHAASLIDALATGLRECKSKVGVGASLQLDDFFDSMLRSRISRWVGLAELGG